MAGGAEVLSRLTGAALRGFLVMVAIALPSVLLPGVTADGKQMVALVALFAGFLTFVEYNARYPGLVEFRDAPPFNRVRFMMLIYTVLMLSLLQRGMVLPSTATELSTAVGHLIGQSMDFPYSPVRLVTITFGEGASPELRALIQASAGIAYLTSLVSLAVFMIVLKAGGWPTRHAAFNVWVNLPTFDPSAGGDVIDRLHRDARFNVALGFLLPFLIPVVLQMGFANMAHVPLDSPQTLVWTMTAWAFLPASLFMRGIAMGRVADMIAAKRRAAGGKAASLAPA
jgi:hypothetical protein